MPDIKTVEAGELITAQDVNEMITKINELDQRVQKLKKRVDDLKQKTSEVEGPFASIPELDFGKAFRLQANGINSAQDLAETDASTVTDLLGTDSDEASTIIDRAGRLVGSP